MKLVLDSVCGDLFYERTVFAVGHSTVLSYVGNLRAQIYEVVFVWPEWSSIVLGHCGVPLLPCHRWNVHVLQAIDLIRR